MPKQKNKIISISAATELYCIFGNPVKHSLSPVMQNAAFRKLGIEAQFTAFEVNNIRNAISAMKALNIRGASVTIPFKIQAMKYVDKVDPLAREIGSINTLCNNNGKIHGYNTDGIGALEALVKNDVKIKGSHVLLLGNGGSARAIAFTLLKEGANIIIAGRNIKKIINLVNDLKKKNNNIYYILINKIDKDYMNKIDIIINTTPIGMKPNTDKMPIEPDLIQKKHTIFDIVYSPHMTKLLKTGKRKGCKVIHGIEMLVNQGAKQFEIWTGKKAPVAIMQKAVRRH
ncbi:MAG: shikimate dehydrogenase [Spirochaetes bacterium]|nr:shikimate dehydrogenase [Spirochaetota bacterium]